MERSTTMARRRVVAKRSRIIYARDYVTPKRPLAQKASLVSIIRSMQYRQRLERLEHNITEHIRLLTQRQNGILSILTQKWKRSA